MKSLLSMAHEIITQYEKYMKPYSTYSWDFQSSDQRDLMKMS